MINRTQGIGGPNESSVLEIAKELYQCAGTGFSGQALFYEKIDELLLAVAQDYHSQEIDIDLITRNYWDDFFPNQKYNTRIENLMLQYRRKRRNWIWAVFKRFKNIKGENIKQLEKVLKVRSAVAQGIYCRDELIKRDSDAYYRTEVSVFLGDSDCLSSGEADVIVNDRMIRELKSIYNNWIHTREDRQLSYQTQTKEAEVDRRNEFVKTNGQVSDRKINSDKAIDSVTDIGRRGDSIQKNGVNGIRDIVGEKDSNNRRDHAYRKVFVNPLLDNVCLQFVMMEITVGERFKPKMHPKEFIENNMEELWHIMPPEIRERRNDWIYYVKNTLYSIKQFRPLLSFNYSDLRDITIKDASRIRICTAHVIAESEDYRLSNEEITERVLVVLREAFRMESDTGNLSRSIFKSLNQFYPYNEDDDSKKLVWTYVNKHKAVVDKWYQWIIEKDRNLADRESADIARRWAEYNERLYLAEKSVRKEVIAELIRGLSDKNYGNILAQMYLIANGQSEEDPGEVLRSFFILLKNMEFCIEPFIDKDCLCPGWKINGEIIVNPGQEE